MTFDDNGGPISGCDDVALQPGADTDALALDGTSGYVTLPNSSIKFTGGDFTVSEWFCPTADNVSGFIFSRCDLVGQKGDISFHVNYWTGHMEFEIFDETGWVLGWDVPESSLHASAGNWNHVLVTRSGYDYSLWMNGQFIGMQTSDADISDADDTNPIIVGGLANSSTVQSLFQGSISELEIWDTALDTDEVAKMNNGGSLFASSTKTDYPESGDLVAAYHFNDNLDDFSGNGNDGTPSTSGVSYTLNTASVSSAWFTTTFSSPGPHTITAIYGGESDTYAPSASAPLAMVVLDTTLPGDGAIVNVPPNQTAPSPLTDGNLVLPFAPAGLTYVSNSNGNAMVAVDATPGITDPSNSESLTVIEATLTVNGYSNSVYYDASDIAADTSYRFTVPINGAYLPTGCYAYTMTFTAFSADDPGGSSMSSLNESAGASGITNVLNWINSPFGQGWNLDGLDQLTFDGSGNVSYVRSDGAMGYFMAGDGDTFTSPAGAFAFLQLSTDGSGNYWLNDASTGTTEAFNSSGALVTVTDRDGNVTSHAPIPDGGAGFTVTDPAGRVTTYSDNGYGQIGTITDFASRITALAYSNGQLTSVTEPDPGDGETQPVTYFSYAAPNSGFTYGGPLTCVIDANGNGTQFAYRNDGTLASVSTADGSSVQYQDALSPLPRGDGEPIGELSGGDPSDPAPLILAATAVGVVTDQNGSPTVYTFNTFGDPTSVENALGNTTIFQRDDNGLVFEMDQPEVDNGGSTITPTTTISYDTVTGLPTSETNPDGLTEEWGYVTTAISTPGGPYWFMTSDSTGAMSGDEFIASRETVYTPDEDTGDVLSVDQEATPGTAAGAGDSIANYTYTTLSSPGGSCPAGLVLTAEDPDGNMTTYVYNTSGSDAGLVSQVELPSDPDDSNPVLVTPDASVYYGYDSADNLTSFIDENGNETDFGYDGLGRPISETSPPDANGQQPVTVLAYDKMGNVTSQQVLETITSGTEVWEATTYSYNSLEQLSEIDAPGPDGSSTDALTYYSYTPTGMLYQVKDATGGVETFGYDALGEQTSDSLPDPATGAAGGATTSYAYDALGRTISVTTPPMGANGVDGSSTTDYGYTFGTYSSPGMTVTTTLPDPTYGTTGEGPATTDIYDQYGDLVSESAPSATGSGNDTTAYSFDALGRPQQQPDPANSSIELGPKFDADGNVVSDTDLQNGATTYYTYNARNELVQTTAPATDGNPDDTHVTQYAYDSAGNLLTQTTYANYAFDAEGNPTEVPPEPMVTGFGYDNLNRQISESLPDPSNGGQDTGSPTTDFGYDLVGNLISTTSPSPTGSGYVTTANSYDQQNNLELTTDANGDVTTFSHDGVGDTLSLTDSDGNTTSWGVDHDGQTTSQSQLAALGYYPDGTVQTTFATSYDFYDPAGNRTSTMDSDHRSISYAYDHLFEETGESWTDASGSAAGGVAYSNNPAGYMTAASNGTGSSTTNIASYGYTYTTSGNVQVENISLAGLGTTAVTLAADYDYNNNRTTLAANIGGSEAPTFNSDGTFSHFNDGTNDFINTYQYNSLGDMTSEVQTSQTSGTYNVVAPKTVTFAYDSAERVTNVNRYATDDLGSLGSSTLVAGAAYSYNDASELTDLKYVDGASTTIAAYHLTYNTAGLVSNFYSYADTLNTTGRTSAYSTWAEASYNYDPTGQLTTTVSGEDTTHAATYSNWQDPAHPTESLAPEDFNYDPNGNRTANTAGSTTSATNRVLFDGTYYYQYDAAGNRIAQYQNSVTNQLDSHATDVRALCLEQSQRIGRSTTLRGL